MGNRRQRIHTTIKACQNGFTLIELIVVVVIVGILLSVGVPRLQGMTANQLSESAKQQLELDIRFARNRAVTTNQPVYIMPGASGYDDGWEVRIDSDANGVFDANDEVIRRKSEFDGNVTIASDDFSQLSPILFNALGRADNQGSLSISTNNCTGPHLFTTRINLIGQVISTTGDCP